jgi:hypothetical protein
MIVQKWQDYLAMPERDIDWHRRSVTEELAEYRQPSSLLNKWSEASDVVYAHNRSRRDGFDLGFPLGRTAYVLGTIYMYPKFTLRYWFFRRAGRRLGAMDVREIRNPRKTHKLHHIAGKYGLDPIAFQTVCERQLKHWLLLP